MLNKSIAKLPKTTSKQKEIISLLYKFRFLNTHQLQLLFKHKNPNRILSWLKDLKEKGYIQTNYSRKTFGDNTKPAVYYLAFKARYILEDQAEIDESFLNRIYKEKNRSKKFIDRCLLTADVYLYLLSQKKEDEELKFFTRTDLTTYEYFPEPLPDAYISVKDSKKTRRYFLDLFDDYTPPFVFRARFKNYLGYSQEYQWAENTNNTPLPSILFVCPSQATKKHIWMYSKSILEKSFNEDLAIYVTTKDQIVYNKVGNIWQKVE